jgi:hypothetical protein
MLKTEIIARLVLAYLLFAGLVNAILHEALRSARNKPLETSPSVLWAFAKGFYEVPIAIYRLLRGRVD